MTAEFIFYVYRHNGVGLTQIDRTCGSLAGAKVSIETEIAVDSYEETDGAIFAIVKGHRVYRIQPVRLDKASAAA